MKKLIFVIILIVICALSCQTIEEMFFGHVIIKEEISSNRHIMRCLVKDLLIREQPYVKKGNEGFADLDKGCQVEYLGEKSNKEIRSYSKTFKKDPDREDYWYKIRFRVRSGPSRGQTWIGWVHGGGMEFMNTPEPIPVVTIQSTSNQNVRKWAVIVGVSEYANSSNNLNYCDDDATAMYNFLKSSEGGGLPDSHITLLLNSQATTQNILAQCNSIFAQASPEDIIIFYFSGHGSPQYFCAYDGSLWHNDIKSILQNSPALRKMLIADACFSGSMNPPPSLNENSYSQYYQNDGIAYMAASQRDQTSVEIHQLKHGLFTYYLLQGLQQCNANEDKDPYINITELSTYIKVQLKNYNQQVPEISGCFDSKMPVSSCQ